MSGENCSDLITHTKETIVRTDPITGIVMYKNINFNQTIGSVFGRVSEVNQIRIKDPSKVLW